MTFHFIRANAQFLPRAFDEANFDFYSRTLRGVEQQRDRWKRGLGVLDGTLGEAVGEIYVRRHFPDSSRRQMTELVGNLRAAFAERLRAIAWMDEATRTAALAKLDAFDPRIGNPVRFIDYSSIRVDRADLLGNIMRAGEFQLEPAAVAAAQSGRSLALGDDAADDQRLLQPAHQPDHLPGRDPAAAFLQPDGGSGGQLRRDRRDHRPRDRPRLRRSGPPLRRRRAAPRLVDGRSRRRRFTERDRAARRAV